MWNVATYIAVTNCGVPLSRKVWDAVTGEDVLTLAHKHIVKSVNFTQVISKLLSWLLLNGSDGQATHPATALSLTSCLWWQDSNHLLTGGNDKLIRIYDLSKPEAGLYRCSCLFTFQHFALFTIHPFLDVFACPSEPQEIPGHTSAIKKALWCNNDKQILSAADDKTVRSVVCP